VAFRPTNGGEAQPEVGNSSAEGFFDCGRTAAGQPLEKFGLRSGHLACTWGVHAQISMASHHIASRDPAVVHPSENSQRPSPYLLPDHLQKHGHGKAACCAAHATSASVESSLLSTSASAAL
jgi:hypothetical protein